MLSECDSWFPRGQHASSDGEQNHTGDGAATKDLAMLDGIGHGSVRPQESESTVHQARCPFRLLDRWNPFILELKLNPGLGQLP